MSWASPESPGTSRRSARRAQTWLLIFLIICVCGLLASLVWSIGVSAMDSRWMPFSLHSILQSDYSVDPRTQLLPPVRFELIKNYLNDKSPSDSPARYATLQGAMNTPVATVTPNYSGASLTPAILSPTATLLPTTLPTHSPYPTKSTLPTLTLTLTPTPTPTVYLSATAWNPPTHLPSPVPTATPKRDDSPEPTQPLPTNPPPTQPAPTPKLPTPVPTLPKSTNPYPPPPYP